MSDTLDEALAYLFRDEGTAYTNDPNDSGGPTKFGVTQRAYISFLGRWVSPDEIAALTPAQAKVFYQSRYWSPLACDRMANSGIATAIFDCGVLYGVGTAAILAQKALSLSGAQLKFDGVLGDKSLAVLNIVKPEEFLRNLHAFLLQRIDSVIKLDPKNERFRKGWTNRADRLLTLSSVAPLNREVT